MRKIQSNCRKVFKGQCPTIQTQVFQMFNGMQVNRQRRLSPIEGAYNYSTMSAEQRYSHFEAIKQHLEQQQQKSVVHTQEGQPQVQSQGQPQGQPQVQPQGQPQGQPQVQPQVQSQGQPQG